MQACAESVATWLRAEGVVPDSVVALQLSRSFEQVVGLLGVVNAGGAYLPMDPKWPLDRRQFMMEDAACRQLIAQSMHAAELLKGGFTGAVLELNDAHNVPTTRGKSTSSFQRPVTTPNHLAYVIFTSGSTGKPKGCTVPHAGVVSLVHALMVDYKSIGNQLPKFGVSNNCGRCRCSDLIPYPYNQAFHPNCSHPRPKRLLLSRSQTFSTCSHTAYWSACVPSTVRPSFWRIVWPCCRQRARR